MALALNLDPEEVKKEFGYTYCPDKNLSGAQLIRNARIYEGLSLCDLSAICCITRQQLRNIEIGKTKKPHRETLVILSDTLEKLELSELLEKFGYQ